MKFKVGDKVELLYGGNKWPLMGYKNGEIYTVAKFPKDVIENHIKNGLIPITGGLQKRGYAKPEQLKLVEPKKTKKQRITELEERVAELERYDRSSDKHIESLEKQIASLLENQETLIKRLDTTERNAFSNMQNTQNLTYELNQLKKRVEELEELHKRKVTMRDVINKVLSEPETIEFEGQKYRKVDREAREGDVVICRNQKNLSQAYIKNGVPYKVGNNGQFEKENVLVYNNYHNRTPETIDVYEPIQQEKTPNQLRVEIIEKAKKFVEKYQAVRKENLHHDEGNIIAKYHWYETEFHAKGNKVTTVVWGLDSGGPKRSRVLAVGRAKCAPGDVFNKYIGMAIALGRALGLDVSEFENAVQPTKPVVGMLFETMGGEIREIGSSDFYSSQSGKSALKSQAVRDRKRIVDDSIARY